MYIPGISAFYHDSAAAPVRDGETVAAAQEERFTRKERDYRFPQHALDYCPLEGRVDPAELHFVLLCNAYDIKHSRQRQPHLRRRSPHSRDLLCSVRQAD